MQQFTTHTTVLGPNDTVRFEMVDGKIMLVCGNRDHTTNIQLCNTAQLDTAAVTAFTMLHMDTDSKVLV